MTGIMAIAAWLAAAGQATGASVTIAVIADATGADPRSIVEGLREAAGEGGKVTLYRLPPGGTIDPIQRGRLLARIQSADLVVTIADRATEFMLAEREKIPVFFVGAASLVRGQALGSPDVAGILPYNIATSLDVLKSMGLAPLGLAYTPGFETVAGQIEVEARVRGLAVIRRAIGSRKGVGPAVRDLVGQARSVWVLGDPLLTRGAGFDFLIEQSLAANVHVVAPGRREVEGGALLSFEPEWAALAGEAVQRVRQRLSGDAASPEPRIGPGPATGTFLVNRVLGARLDPPVPPETKWRNVP